MNQENRDNLARLEEIRAQLWRIADLFNKAGYEASAPELAVIDNISQLAQAVQNLARR